MFKWHISEIGNTSRIRNHPNKERRSCRPQRPIDAIGVRLATGTHQAGFAGSRTWKRDDAEIFQGNVGHFTRNLGCWWSADPLTAQNDMDFTSYITMFTWFKCITNCWLNRGCFRWLKNTDKNLGGYGTNLGTVVKPTCNHLLSHHWWKMIPEQLLSFWT